MEQTKQRSGRDGQATTAASRDSFRASTSATELLRRDHEHVKQLFGRLQRGGHNRRALAEEIFTELELHAMVEEQAFYPAYASISQEAADTVAVSIQEHEVVKNFIRDLQRLSPSDAGYAEAWEALREHVLDHATEEEETVFPIAELHLDVYDLGQRIQALKQGGTLHPLRSAASWLTAAGGRWSSSLQGAGGSIRRNPAAVLLAAALLLVVLSPWPFLGARRQ
jgi:hemerythrin superfamily protein